MMAKHERKRYYVMGEVVPFEEDATHEFKGHLNLSIEEIHPGLWLQGADAGKRSRQPISRVINAFLNSGIGGIIYMGIVDDGTVKGINLTQYKKDHIIAALDDLMQRYFPPVEEHRYKVKFIPVVNGNVADDELVQITTFDTSSTTVLTERQRPHTLRTYKYCWCDKDAVMRYNSGIMANNYVIELTIKPWNPDDPLNKYAVGKMKAQPIHEDETSRSYFRRQASVVQYNVQEQCNFSQTLVDDKYGPEIERLKEELKRLRRESVK